MLVREHTRKALEKFANDVRIEAINNLQANKYTGNLEKSITSDIDVSENSITLSMKMAEYGFYLDEGVRGAKEETKAPNSRFKFGRGTGSRNGLRKAIKSWVEKKRIQWRTNKGKFLGYDKTAVLISKRIYNTGLRPSRFMTKALEKEFKTLPSEITEAYGLDLKNFLDFVFKDNIKSIK